MPAFPDIPPEEAAGELIVPPSGVHTHTVIMLHSVKNAAEMFSRLYRRFGPVVAGFKFVFPRAPLRRILSMQTGSELELTAWYNPTKRSEEGALQADGVDMEQLTIQTKRMHGIMDREAALLGGDCSKLVLDGAYQGGSVAMHAAMAYRAPINGVICARAASPLSHSPYPSDRWRGTTREDEDLRVCG